MEEKINNINEKIMKMLESSRNSLYENLEHSFEAATEALQLSKEQGFEKGEAIALVRLAAVYAVRGEFEKAASLSYKAKYRVEELRLEIQQVDVMNNLGNIFADQGDYEKALSYYMDASKILERQEDSENVNYFKYVLNNNIGEIYSELRSFETAIEYFEKSLEFIKNNKKKNYILVPYINIAEVYQKQKNFEKALLYINKSISILKKYELSFFEPDIFFCLAKIYADKGMYEDAHGSYEKVIKLLKEKEFIYFLVNVLLEFYNFLLKYEKKEEAIEVLKEAHNISLHNNYKMKLSEIYSSFAEFYEGNRKYREALNYYKYYYREEKFKQNKESDKKLLHLKNQLKINKIEHEKELMDIKNTQLKERAGEIEKLFNDITIISEMGRDITSVLDLDKVVFKTQKYFSRIINFKDFGLVIYDESGKKFEFSYISGKDKKSIEKQFKMEKNFLRFHLQNSREEILFYSEDKTELYISLIIEERVIGGLFLNKKIEKDYSKQDKTVLTAFTNYVAIALNNAQKSMKLKEVNQKLLSLSLKDGLTEIANRRRFEEVFKREWWRAVRYKTPMSVIMFDIDRFKQYNDNYGHLEGDEIIRTIAKTADQFFKRAIDLVARYGGDEFVVVLPDTELEDTVELAEKLRNHIENKLKLIHDYSDISNYITITLGVASTYPSSKLTEKKLLDVADEALYLAKKNGRNRVEFLMLSSS